MITAESPFLSAPRISRSGFTSVIHSNADAAVASERDPGEYWDAIRIYGVDPLFVLAMFQHESNMGRYGVARTTHSWGNTRAPSFGADPTGEIAGRSGTFPVFANWLDGAKSTAARLVEPTWVYAGRQTIREIFEHPSGDVWAPAGDMNDPTGYVRAVLDFMNRYADGGETMPAQIPGFEWHPADDRHYAPGRGMPIRGGAQHYSAGTNSLDWLSTTSGVSSGTPVSAHFLVRHTPTMDARGWQLVRLEDTAWATGGIVNPFVVAIEYEHPGNGTIGAAAYEVLAQTWADVTRYVRDHGLGDIEVIRGHRDWVGDNRTCPDGVDVPRIVQRWQVLMGISIPSTGDAPALPPATPDPWGDSNPHKQIWVLNPFLSWIEAHGGFLVMGYVQTPAELVGDALVQWFERGRLEYHADGSVTAGLVGAELLMLLRDGN